MAELLYYIPATSVFLQKLDCH